MKKFIEIFFKAGMPMIYGVSWLAFTLSAIVSIVGYLFKVYQGEREFQLSIVVILAIVAAAFFFGGYVLVKVAEQEYSKSKKS